MAIFRVHPTLLFILAFLLLSQSAFSFIGYYLDLNIDQRPSPYDLVDLLNTTHINRMRISSLEPDYIIPLKVKVGIDFAVTTSNFYVEQCKDDVIFCRPLVREAFSQYKLHDHIQTIIVGDNIFEYRPQDVGMLMNAIHNTHAVLNEAGLAKRIKVTTVVSTIALTRSDIPTQAEFRPEYLSIMQPLLQYLRENQSPLMMATYPYYEFNTTATPNLLKRCLFLPNYGIVDPGSGLNYTDMFSIKVDSMRMAMYKLGYIDVDVVVGETGWPSHNELTDIGASLKNAKLYNTNLISFLRSNVGTPLMPNKSIDTYLATLIDTDDNPTELGMPPPDKTMGIVHKAMGILHKDLTWKYDINLQH